MRWTVVTNCDSFFVTKCDTVYYKLRQVLQSAMYLLQIATGITKCDDYYKLRQYKCQKSDKHFKLVSLKSIVSVLFMQFELSLTPTTPTLFLMALQPTMCYYNSGQLLVSLQITTTFITIDASLVITFLDNYYCNLQQILQFTTIIITIYDRYYNSRQNTRGFTHCFPWIRRKCSVSDQSQFSQSYDSSCFRSLACLHQVP